ncbi:hypothetical protein BDQ94DRAFT_134825 [Aspergillus welwitschiae]|uniref:Uncharacterized protein n=1 Tax=Aspergillus welwitschiae TaxID=1341132 RepID=A0A3F3QI86_9EURO|nr:hypothetical protein BDQ94DRAFT_134825 [Aspergillus welwitschiae]RDH38891.1 hypothetical protein BDQ94DRAFT_134825 [Aspergillus welwitschiae]
MGAKIMAARCSARIRIRFKNRRELLNCPTDRPTGLKQECELKEGKAKYLLSIYLTPYYIVSINKMSLKPNQ